MPKTFEHWLVENTGWSGGVSWFDDKQRYENYAKALSVASNRKNSSSDDSIKWRITHVITTYEHTEL